MENLLLLFVIIISGISMYYKIIHLYAKPNKIEIVDSGLRTYYFPDVTAADLCNTFW